MKPIERNKPWETIETYWDTENGEKLNKKEAKKHYKIYHAKTIKYGGQYRNTKERQYYCTREQLRLF